ncbi:MAG: hypothetical protein ACOC9Q_03490 [bacterium]
MDPSMLESLCDFPARLHPVSQLILESFIEGRMPAGEFLRSFSLPNSDYIPLARCFVALVTGETGVL